MFVAAFLLVAAQAAAGPQVSAAPPVSAPAQMPKKERKTCRADDADSGSHMVHRVCLTAPEWQERDQGAMDGAHSGISGKATDD